MYINRNFHVTPRSIGGFIEDVFQNGKVLTDELWNENKMHVPVNIQENDKAYELKVVAPGIAKEDFKLSVDKNVLTISYEHKEEAKEETNKSLRSEYKVKSFKRSFTLNDKINTAAISAKYNDGILNVTLTKKEVTENPAQEISVG